jgi:predicted amidohydrolase YtcJ
MMRGDGDPREDGSKQEGPTVMDRAWIPAQRALALTMLSWLALGAAEDRAEAKLTVFTAEKIITMDRSLPEATAVAVAGDRIVAVGTLESMQPWLEAREHVIDHTFADKVILPGLIDNHLHPIMAALLLDMHFVTPHEWQLPWGDVERTRGRDAYLIRLAELEAGLATSDEPLFAWGYHPLFHGELGRDDLDRISETRPIIAWHRSFHEIFVNTAALRWMGISEANVGGRPGVDLDNGHFFEMGLEPAVGALSPYLLAPERIARGLERMREAVHHGGLTTIGDMASGLFDLELEWQAIRDVLESDETPFRVHLVPDGNLLGLKLGNEKGLELIETLPRRNTHRLRYGRKQVKLFADGAFYSQLMQLGPPGYIDGHHGEWIMTPERLEEAARLYWNAGYQIHVHVNGDAGVEVVLDVLERLLLEKPRADHRYALHHYGYSTSEQARRVASLGAIVSANPYYLWALGDRYAEVGLGPERAAQMTRLGSLVRRGVPVSLHSDFTMAPARPLLLAWVAATRTTAEGTVMAPEERLTLEEALRGITIDAAHAIRLENEVGSIVAGKKADFTVLEADPYAAPVERLKDIPIWGTVFEGRPYPASR